MALVLLFAAWVDSQVPQLGADDWRNREAAEARLDHFLPALFLPRSSEDPEIDHRLRALRTRNLKWFRADHLERRLFAADFTAWVDLYLYTGRSRVAADVDAWAAIHGSHEKAWTVFRRWSPYAPFNGGGFLTGSFQPGEYETWLDFMDYHLARSPMPRVKP